MAGHIPDSASVCWCTPAHIIVGIHATFDGPPGLDPCSNAHSKVGAAVEYRLDNQDDGLLDPWDEDTFYVNPPFGKMWWRPDPNHPGRRLYIDIAERKQLVAAAKTDPIAKSMLDECIGVSIKDWVRRCVETVGTSDKAGIALIPAYPGTSTWQDYVWPYARAVFFPRGRLHFDLPDGPGGPAPMDCALIFFARQNSYYTHKFHQAFHKFGKVIHLP